MTGGRGRPDVEHCAYLSPEQCLGRQLDRRSDVFSLGVVLAELATGERLFAGADLVALLRAIVDGVRRELAGPLAAVLERALATDPDRRYGSADELRVALLAVAAPAALELL